jgi:hypothetical protein
VSVHVDDAGHYGAALHIDRARACWNIDAWADGFDPVVIDQDRTARDHLVASHRNDPRICQCNYSAWSCRLEFKRDLGRGRRGRLTRLLTKHILKPLLVKVLAKRPRDRLAVAAPR